MTTHLQIQNVDIGLHAVGAARTTFGFIEISPEGELLATLDNLCDSPDLNDSFLETVTISFSCVVAACLPGHSPQRSAP